jgi:aspartate aminotransferase/aminotransferase
MLARMCSAVPVSYDLYPGTPLDEAALEARLTERTRAILVNSPSNPTGRALTDAELRAVGAVAGRHGLTVMSDEIYDAFVYDGPHVSAFGRVPSDRLLVLGGWSKTYAMPGWRLGWAVGPDELVDAMRRMQQFSFVCAPSLVQKAGLAALEVDMSAEIAAYRGKRDRLVAGLSGHYELAAPGGSFYMFPRLPAGLDGDGFLERTLERHLLVVPGKAFSARDSHFRLSFAAADDVLERGLAALVDIAEAVARG